MRQLLFLGILLCVQWAHGQNNNKYKRGYMVTNQGDTLQGEINFNWNQRPTSLSFKQGSLIQSYTVEDIASFQIKGGDLFIRKDVEVDVSPTMMENLLEIGNDPMEPMRLFLKVLQLGKANLYQSFDEKRQRFHYFLETAQSDGTVELIENRRKVPEGSYEADEVTASAAGAVKTQDKYKGQLLYLLKGCDRSVLEIQGMKELTQKSIMKIIESFNTCQSKKITYRQDKILRGSKIEFGIMAGIQMMDVTLEDEITLPDGINTDASLSPVLGLDLQFQFSNRRVFGLGLQAFYSRFATNETFFERRAVLSGFSTIDYEWEQLTTLAKFNFNFGASDKFFFANTGFGVNWIGNARGDKSLDSGSDLSVLTSNKDRHLIFSLGGGYQHKRLRTALDLEIGTNSIHLQFADTRTLSLKISYFLL